MPRAVNKVASHRRRRKLLKQAEGFRGARKNLYRVASCAVLKSQKYAYRDRRQRKRDMRRLWILRIGAGARQNHLSYSTFINGLRRAGVDIDRKLLADLAVRDEQAFTSLVQTAREHLAASG